MERGPSDTPAGLVPKGGVDVGPAPMKRIPRNGMDASGGIVIPSCRSAATPFGMTPSPQVLSIGGSAPSATVTSRPCCRAAMAVARPAGPPPTTKMSARGRLRPALGDGPGAGGSSSLLLGAETRLGSEADHYDGRHAEEEEAWIAQPPRDVRHLERGLDGDDLAREAGLHGERDRVLGTVQSEQSLERQHGGAPRRQGADDRLGRNVATGYRSVSSTLVYISRSRRRLPVSVRRRLIVT